MSNVRQRENRVKALRIEHDWTQAELANRAAISRAAVSAIEINRLVPSVSAALSLAKALGCSVEDLFGAVDESPAAASWAWPPLHEPCRYWEAKVGSTNGALSGRSDRVRNSSATMASTRAARSWRMASHRPKRRWCWRAAIPLPASWRRNSLVPAASA